MEKPGGKVGAKKNLYRLVKVSRQLALPTAPGLLPVLTATAVKLLPFEIALGFCRNLGRRVNLSGARCG
jgi:hypothetical protein